MAKTVKIKYDVETDEAVNATDNLTESTEDLNKASEETNETLSETGKSAEGGVGGVKKLGASIGGLVKAAGIIGIIVAAFGKLQEAFSRNQKFADLFTTAMTAVEIIADKLIQQLEPLADMLIEIFENPVESLKKFGELIKTNITNRFEAFIDTLGLAAKAIKQVFAGDFSDAMDTAKEAGKRFIDVGTGIEGTFDKTVELAKGAGEAFKNLATEIKTAVTVAGDLTELENRAKIAEANGRQLLLIYQTQAEAQRQIRDDTAKSIPERIAANEKLAAVLAEQSKVEQANALIAVQLAEKRLSQNKTNIDLQVALINAKTEQIDINERLEGQRSEQLTNINGLLDEQKANELELAAIGKADAELTLKALDDELAARLIIIEKTIEDEDEKTRIIVEAKKDRQRQIDAIDDKADKDKEAADAAQKLKDDKKNADDKKALIDKAIVALNTASFVANGLAELAGDNLEAQKAFNIAAVTIDTAVAIISAFKLGPVIGAVMSPIIAAVGIAQISKIANTTVDKPAAITGTPNIPSPASIAAETPEAPQNVPPGDPFGEFGLIQPAPRAWVLASDVSDELEANKKLERRAVLA